ncbi:MAG: SRPBCC family protein [Chloroflexi bacterium]|nr:SRPBCC family protein [Chloroflexota bacterium]
MPVKKDATGRRSVQAEIEVPGSPEEVWEAIATGPGISAWFVPSEVKEGQGGTVVSHFGPGSSMDAVATITDWKPPHRFIAESGDLGPEAPAVATEWIVEARAGGTCVVRVVHSWFASSDDWDNQFEQHQHGWIGFFRILRLYLTHFRGQPCAAFQLMGVAPEPKAVAWATLTGALGLAGAVAGQRVSSPPDAPSLAGAVEQVGPAEYPEDFLLRLDEPAPGLAHLFALPMGGQVYLPIRFFYYGDQAHAVVASVERHWQVWLSSQVSPVEEAPSVV